MKSQHVEDKAQEYKEEMQRSVAKLNVPEIGNKELENKLQEEMLSKVAVLQEF